jgi:hypothetical protein
MMKDVSDGKIVSQGGIHQRTRSDQDSNERRHTGAARRFRQAVANSVFTYSGNDADYKTVASERQSE